MYRDMRTISIIGFDEQYRNELESLTLEWLEKYVSVEPEDEQFLANPAQYVMDREGAIFLAKCEDQVVGTVSLYKLTAGDFELAKLAVTESYKGLKIGNSLVEHCIEECRQRGARRIVLFTTKRLEAAYRLYLKYGFIEVPEVDQKYIEADIKMVLEL